MRGQRAGASATAEARTRTVIASGDFDELSAVDRDEQARKLMAVAGKYRDAAGGRHVSRRHDEVLAEAFRR